MMRWHGREGGLEYSKRRKNEINSKNEVGIVCDGWSGCLRVVRKVVLEN